MAKKKSSRNSGKKAPKLPKTIAGVKIPKSLRDTVEPVLQWADHPLVSEILAAAVTAGAASLTGKAGDAARKAGKRQSRDLQPSKPADRLGLAVAVAAGEIAARIVTSYAKGAGKSQAASRRPKAAAKAPPAPVKGRRKKSASSAGKAA